VLGNLRDELPLLAEVDPDPWFVGDVLDGTTRRRSRDRSAREALTEWSRRLVRRPRIAQELAYVMSVILFIAAPARLPQGGTQGPHRTAIGADLPGGVAATLGEAARAGSEFLLRIELPAGPIPGWTSGAGLGSRASHLSDTCKRLQGTLDLIARCCRDAGVALIHMDTKGVQRVVRVCREGIRERWGGSRTTEPSPALPRTR